MRVLVKVCVSLANLRYVQGRGKYSLCPTPLLALAVAPRSRVVFGQPGSERVHEIQS